MNNGLEGIQTEVVIASFRYYPNICLEGLRKTTKEAAVRISSLLAEFQTKNLPKINGFNA
jgi:hypothetical protein